MLLSALQGESFTLDLVDSSPSSMSEKVLVPSPTP
jgi:hypothetical protein